MLPFGSLELNLARSEFRGQSVCFAENGYAIRVIPTPEAQTQAPTTRRLARVVGWSALAAGGGAIIYSLFTRFTGMEASLTGIPVGLAVGQYMHYASGRRGGRWFQVLAVLCSFVAFDLTYASGMAGVVLKHGITFPAFAFLSFITLASPVIDPNNGFLGQFMVVAGMYLAWTLARTREAA